MGFFSSADKQLWLLALPMILSNITVPVLGLVDTAVIGHLDSAVYLGGVAVGTTATNLLFMLLLFLRMSTTGLTAQAYGAGNKPALARALVQPLLMAMIAGTVLLALKTPLTWLAVNVVGGNDQVLHQAAAFMHIRWISAPATLANMVLLGWLLGVQYARAPVILLVIGNLVNILLDLWFVPVLGWGVRGAAAATVIAEYSTLGIGLVMVWHVLRLRGVARQLLRRAWRGSYGYLLRLNRDIMLRSLMLQLCMASLTVIGARLGSDIVAANAVLLMFLTFTAYALDGFAYAVEACSGEAVGARDPSRLLHVWHAACRQAGLLALLFSLLYFAAGSHIVALLTSLPAVQLQAGHFLGWQAILPLAGVWCFLLDGMFIGATRARDMRNSMAIAMLGFALTLLTIPLWGNHGLWLAVTVFLLLRGAALWWVWRREWHHGRWFNYA
ncbi:MATE family efflux transporter DinF [Izhakiella australiensis]|uniref:MATE family efflux transporter DinF n=1 Tax=Izhakiella australiensis TaxID=1926881 RepID=A0A1S8YR46_9GAMM|nr:MATE family efflux transporter DinF [Izhakiella australiensis]OON41619.1 MATE family efflux transporter DinF [Izhakiella australiensis]